MKKNSTWRALLFSMFSMLICATMLIGSTWAWFTATASLGTTAIYTGNLDIALIGADGEPLSEPLRFMDDDTMAAALWEPTKTFRTEGFKVVNTGNLSLKYTVSVIVPQNNPLTRVISFTLVTVGEDGAETRTALTANGELPVGGSSGLMYIEGYMAPDASSEYQKMMLEGLTIVVHAAQSVAEADSYGNAYDSGAQFDTDAAQDAGAAEDPES